MAKLDVLKTIEKTRGHVADRYDVYPEDLMKIMEKYVHPYSIASAAFTLGYAQGVKASEAKQKKDMRKWNRLHNQIKRQNKLIFI